MRIYVKVVPRAGMKSVEEIVRDGKVAEYKVRTTAVAEKGRANACVIAQLAKYFKVAKSRVNIVGGASARIKIVDII
jgi:uncharacterized protein YggU (UPF0235/DUF167 family)